VHIRLLGGVGATTDDGDPVDVGPGRCQAVLAALALSPGTAVPVWRLVELVWGDAAPRTAEKTLQSYVTRLRKALGPDSIIRTGAAYRLDLDAESVDVLRFQRHLDAGDVAAALREWTGPPLAGLDAPGLAAPAAGLVEQWLGAVETDLERLVETNPPAAIGPLTELTASHPFREGLWALLMTALYKVGRQAEALAA
jgi:DNA-binding SARP family transcriptional activator